MKRIKKIKKSWRVRIRIFKVFGVIALLCLLYFGTKCFVYAEESVVERENRAAEKEVVSAEQMQTASEEIFGSPQAQQADVLEAKTQAKEETKPDNIGLASLTPEGVVYDPKGESFVTINGEVVKEGGYVGEFLLESITPEKVVFSNEDEMYEIPSHPLDHMKSVIDSFEDIHVDGLLYDSKGKSFVVINGLVMSEGDTIGGFLVESIGESQVTLRKESLRFEVFMPPHFEEERAEPINADALLEAKPIHADSHLTDVKPNAAVMETAVPVAIGK